MSDINTSETQQDPEVRLEIQKLLVTINDDMAKLKNELAAVNSLLQPLDSASIPLTADMFNEKLILWAKELGLLTEDWDKPEPVKLNKNEKRKSSYSRKKGSKMSYSAQANAADVAASAEKLTQQMKHTFKKQNKNKKT